MIVVCAAGVTSLFKGVVQPFYRIFKNLQESNFCLYKININLVLHTDYMIASGPCQLPHCPVDGILSPWGAWSPCEGDCGTGVARRRRECVGPEYGGRQCEGSVLEVAECDTSRACGGQCSKLLY